MTPKNECPLIVDRLGNLLENDLPPGELLLIRAHLQDCEACSRAFTDTKSIIAGIAARDDDHEEAWIESTLARVPQMLATERLPPVRNHDRTLALSFAALLVLATTLKFATPDDFAANSLKDVPRAVLERLRPLASQLRGFYFVGPSRGDAR